jgi:hypothetical protein
VPLDYWATPEVDERLMAEFDLPDLAALRRFLKVDMVHVPVPLKEGARKYLSDGDFIDEWGCRQTWQKHPSGGGYRERITAPLADIDSIEGLSKFEFPRLDVYDWSSFPAISTPTAASPSTVDSTLSLPGTGSCGGWKSAWSIWDCAPISPGCSPNAAPIGSASS